MATQKHCGTPANPLPHTVHMPPRGQPPPWVSTPAPSQTTGRAPPTAPYQPVPAQSPRASPIPIICNSYLLRCSDMYVVDGVGEFFPVGQRQHRRQAQLGVTLGGQRQRAVLLRQRRSAPVAHQTGLQGAAASLGQTGVTGHTSDRGSQVTHQSDVTGHTSGRGHRSHISQMSQVTHQTWVTCYTSYRVTGHTTATGIPLQTGM